MTDRSNATSDRPDPRRPFHNDRIQVMVPHFAGTATGLLSLGVLGFVGPLVVYLARGNQSKAVRASAAAALNFQLALSIVALVVLFPSSCWWFVPNVLLMVIQAAYGIRAGLRVGRGQRPGYWKLPQFIQ